MNADSLLLEEIRISSISSVSNSLRSEIGDITELAESIKENGLIEPIVIRPKDGKFELVAGSRRLAACRMLGWRKIRSQIATLDEKQAFELGLAENIARKTLNPYEEARAFEEYISKNGWGSETELAKKIGKSTWYISRRLRLLSLPPESVDQLLRRHNNPSLLEELIRVEDPELRTNLINMTPELDLSSKDVRRLRRRIEEKTRQESQAEWIETAETKEERRNRLVNHACSRTVLALRVALHRLDEVLESVKDKDWILTEILMQQRQALHSQIDLFGSLSRRIEARQDRRQES